MKTYLDIVRKVLEQGSLKDNRTGIDTLAVPFVHFEHDMADGFPLLTTKRMPLRVIAVELDGFLKGITSKGWYQERGCHIWDQWCNPKKIRRSKNVVRSVEEPIEFGGMRRGVEHLNIPLTNEERLEQQHGVDDLGPIYGYQWRSFNKVYDEEDGGTTETYDQFKEIVQKLRHNPNDRRMVCSAWNPQHISRQALPPCHILWNVVVIGDKLSLGWYQRSCDLMLGVPFNIASYGLLLELLAAEAGLKPGKLSGTLADCHIYINQLDGAREQLAREPRELPKLHVVFRDSIFNWTHEQLSLENYNPYPRISFGEVAV